MRRRVSFIRHLRSPLALCVLVAVAVILASAYGLADRNRETGVRSSLAQDASASYAELVARNYRVLTPAQTQRLLRFAHAFRSCMSRRGVQLGKPEPMNTKIELAIPPRTDRQGMTRLGVTCGETLGDPPLGASLLTVQQGGKAVTLYLPKRCLLSKHVVK